MGKPSNVSMCGFSLWHQSYFREESSNLELLRLWCACELFVQIELIQWVQLGFGNWKSSKSPGDAIVGGSTVSCTVLNGG